MLYEIEINHYDHVGGHDYWTENARYEDLNTAKRKLIELIKEDDLLGEDNVEVSISKDCMWAFIDRDDFYDYNEYQIIEAELSNIIKEKSNPVSKKELEELSNFITEEYEDTGVEITEGRVK